MPDDTDMIKKQSQWYSLYKDMISFTHIYILYRYIYTLLQAILN